MTPVPRLEPKVEVSGNVPCAQQFERSNLLLQHQAIISVQLTAIWSVVATLSWMYNHASEKFPPERDFRCFDLDQKHIQTFSKA